MTSLWPGSACLGDAFFSHIILLAESNLLQLSLTSFCCSLPWERRRGLSCRHYTLNSPLPPAAPSSPVLQEEWSRRTKQHGSVQICVSEINKRIENEVPHRTDSAVIFLTRSTAVAPSKENNQFLENWGRSWNKWVFRGDHLSLNVFSEADNI